MIRTTHLAEKLSQFRDLLRRPIREIRHGDSLRGNSPKAAMNCCDLGFLSQPLLC
jgi:hypothetical protein